MRAITASKPGYSFVKWYLMPDTVKTICRGAFVSSHDNISVTTFDADGNYLTTPKPFTMDFRQVESFVDFPPYTCTCESDNKIKPTIVISANTNISPRCEEMSKEAARIISGTTYGDGFVYGIWGEGVFNSCLVEVVGEGPLSVEGNMLLTDKGHTLVRYNWNDCADQLRLPATIRKLWQGA